MHVIRYKPTIEIPSEKNHGDIHHNNPQSRFGSNDDGNLTGLPVTRHRKFHKFALNALPMELVGRQSIQSIAHPNPDKRMTPSQVHACLNASRMPEVSYAKTLLSSTHPGSAVRHMQHLFHTTIFLQLELGDVQHTLDVIEGRKAEFSPDHHTLALQAMTFFDVRTTSDAIRGLLDEKINSQFVWSKPLKYEVRNSLCKVLNPECSNESRERSEYRYALMEHQGALQKRLDLIKETATRLQHELEQLMTVTQMDPFQARQA